MLHRVNPEYKLQKFQIAPSKISYQSNIMIVISTLDIVISMLLIAAKDIANLMQYDSSISSQKWSSINRQYSNLNYCYARVNLCRIDFKPFNKTRKISNEFRFRGLWTDRNLFSERKHCRNLNKGASSSWK